MILNEFLSVNNSTTFPNSRPIGILSFRIKSFNLKTLIVGVKPALILGPVCSVAADGVNDFSKHWNVPMMTSGAMARAFTLEHQPTLTRYAQILMYTPLTFILE